MILETLKLYNVGAFNGWHRFDLEPENPKKPVVLVGALNGCGKTTIHETIQLALFGPQSAPSQRHRKGYDNFLTHLLNSDADQEDGAVVELSFRHSEDGEERRYRVRRTWKVKGKRVQKGFDVYIDGAADKVLADLWQEKIHDIFPARIASFFFFDGEQIEELADFERLPVLLKEAVHSLLGLDLVEQLRLDLNVLATRKRVRHTGEAIKKQIAELEQELEEVEARRQEQLEQLEELKREQSLRQSSIAEKREEFKQSGGDLFEQFESLSKDRAAAGREMNRLRTELIVLSEEELPLSLLETSLAARSNVSVRSAVAQERERAALDVIAERDDFIRNLLSDLKVKKTQTESVMDALAADRVKRTETLDKSQAFSIDRQDGVAFDQLEVKLPAAKTAAQKLSDALVQCHKTIDDLDRKLSSIPSEDQIAKTKGELKSLTNDLNRIEMAENKQNAELASIEYRLNEIKKKISSILEKAFSEQAAATEAARMVSYIESARNDLDDFGKRVVKHHIRRIEQLAVSAINTMMRKETLISQVEIDAETFELKLRSGDWSEINVRRLSAGERQLVATALLWALAQAAGREYPTVIDTPLGRLDSKHRSKLVEKYFPAASGQVILLSTDEEIVGRYYKKISPHVSHSYTLEYSDKTRSTNVVEGYRFEETLQRAH